MRALVPHRSFPLLYLEGKEHRLQKVDASCFLSFSSSANIYHYFSPFKVSFVVKRDKAQSRGKAGTKLVIVYAFLSVLTM